MSIIQKIFSALNADEKQAVKTELAQAELKEGTMIEADSFEEGQAVFIITEDGEKIPMPEGTYELEDGRKVEVNDSSMIVAIGSGEEDKAEEVEQEAKEEMEEKEKEEMSEDGEATEVEAKEEEKEAKAEMGDMDKLREELRQYVREVVMEAMQEKEEMSSEEGEAAPEAVAEETEEKAEEVAVEASAQKVTAKIKVKPEGTRPDSIDWFKPQTRSTTMGNVFKHINK
jgi:ribosomal protein L21E